MHKKIGILGGMSPESTITYYQTITHLYTEWYGDYGYPEILIYSVSFQDYVDWPNADRWDLVAAGLRSAALHLENAGADFILIATNTMHLVVDAVRAGISIPVLSLLDVVGAELSAQGVQTAGLLGTRFTMESSLYPDALEEYGIQIAVPDPEDREVVNDIIYKELVAGEIRAESRARYLAVIEKLTAQGAQGIILGCTEIPLLVGPGDVDLPLFDTTRLHAEAALNVALSSNP
jgi:aspartate racemase